MSGFDSIRSAENPRFKQWRKLAQQPAQRRKTGLTLLDGVHLLQMLAQSGGLPEQLLVRSGSQDFEEVRAIITMFSDVPLVLLTPVLFNQIVPSEHPFGVAALLRIPEQATHAAQGAALLLEAVQDPGNLGTMLRTAAAADVRDVYLSSGCCEGWSPKALRAGMGAHFALSLHERQDLQAVAARFSQSVALLPDVPDSLYDLDLRGDVAFLLGNEGAGLSPELAACAIHRASIPMPGSVESLNVAAAAAVCLFERVRQRLG